jgi:hypothetical protein
MMVRDTWDPGWGLGPGESLGKGTTLRNPNSGSSGKLN